MMRLGPAVVLAARLAGDPDAAAWRLRIAGGLAVGALALAAVGFGIGLGWPHLLTRVFYAPAARKTDRLVRHHGAALRNALTAALAGVTNSAGLAQPRGRRRAAGRLVAVRRVFHRARAGLILLIRHLRR